MEPTLPMPTNLAESIRSSLHAVVSQQTSVSELAPITESTLIRNGSYCGRKFSLVGYSLVWFQEEGQVKLYSPTGSLEISCSVAQFCEGRGHSPVVEVRRAA